MPPKKGYRKSMPAVVNNSTTLIPSRRSPRVPSSARDLKKSPTSTKSLDLSSLPSEDPFNIQLYNPKTPPSNRKAKYTSPDLPSTRRRTFKPRPSRLSSVYTPVVDTPDSSQSSRRTRRTTVLETPQEEYSDHHFAESVGSTGWTYEQYLGGKDYDEAMAKTSPSASSKGTRASTRIRKPTTRAIEALETTQRTSRGRASAPAPAPVPTKGKSQVAPAVATKKVTKKPAKASTGKKGQKGKNVPKEPQPALKKIEIDIDQAGKNLYELAVVALGPAFVPPPDAEQFVSGIRNQYNQPKTDEPQNVQPAHDGQPSNGNGDANDTSKDKGGKRTIAKLKKRSPPQLDADGWTNSGRVNESGEEVVLTPPNHSPFRSPHTYGDEALPVPPVRARSDQQAEDDNALGFPPLIGDRNIPFDAEAQFLPEDVTEEKARAQARQKDQKDKSGTATPAPTETSGRTRGRKRRLPEPEPAATEVTSGPTVPVPGQDSGRKPKRQRSERVSMPAALPRKAAPNKKPAPRPAKAGAKAPAPVPPPAADDTDKPKLQRIRLKLKPAPDTQASGPSNDVAPSAATDVATTKAGTSKGKKQEAILISDDEMPKKKAAGSKGKPKGADLTSEVGAPGSTDAPKQSRRVKGCSRAASAPAARGRGHGRGRGRGGRG